MVDSENIKVNGNTIKSKRKCEQSGDDIRYVYEVKLKGSTEYFIEQILNKKYKLEEDNYLGFQAKWLVNGMNIQLLYPQEKIIPVFLHRGTSDDFIVKNRYIIILNKKHWKEFNMKTKIELRDETEI